MHEKKNSTRGIKILLTAGVLTGTVTLWNLFSDQAVKKTLAQAAEAQKNAQNSLATQAALPTNVPTSQPLRVVNAPQGASLASASQPIVQTVIVNQSGGGSTSGSMPAPITNTGSSK